MTNRYQASALAVAMSAFAMPSAIAQDAPTTEGEEHLHDDHNDHDDHDAHDHEKTLDTVISGEGRADIEQNVLTRMQLILDNYGSGINVEGVEIDKADPPEQVIEAFNDVLAAQQDAERELNQARRFAQQLLAKAEGEAAEFNEIYAQYKLAPEVTRRRLYYETMEAVLANTDKTVIEADGVTPYLPLSEIQRRSSSSANAQQGGQ